MIHKTRMALVPDHTSQSLGDNASFSVNSSSLAPLHHLLTSSLTPLHHLLTSSRTPLHHLLTSTANTSLLPGEPTTDTTLPDTPLSSFPLYQASEWLWRVMPPLIFIFGTFGNVMAIVILTRMRCEWSAMSLYLRALAVSDQCVITVGPMPIWIKFIWRYDLRLTHRAVCKLRVWLLNGAHLLSPWLLVVLTLQRAASVVWPHRVHVICTPRVSVVVIATLVLVSYLLYSQLLYGFDLVPFGAASVRCGMVADYKAFMDRVWVKLDIFLLSVLPFSCLVVSNGVLIHTLARSVRSARQRLTPQGPEGQAEQVERRERKVSSTTVTLIAVSGIFVVLMLPVAVKSIAWSLRYTARASQSTSLDTIALNSFLDVLAYMLAYCNNAVNFYVYCLTGTRFRQEFVKVMCLARTTWGQSRARDTVQARKQGARDTVKQALPQSKDHRAAQDKEF